MNFPNKAKGVIINPSYVRPAILKALVLNLKGAEEEDREEGCAVKYVDRKRNFLYGGENNG
ncbi:MAG: hypothetical protein SWK76_05435 [Actinomycetota bacterium]|nr:hypothetical protein [Actinomycetota bacterium]